jgi:DNA-directed RNA polymerase specialized sigma24 family protein
MGNALRKELEREQLDVLLDALAPDRDEAGRRYTTLHRRLVAFFDRRDCVASEDCADDVMNRVARQLERGLALPRRAPYAYFLGVARNVLREHRRAVERERALGEALHMAFPLSDEQARRELRIDCLAYCLGRLPEERRALVVGYFAADGGERIAQRRRLADELGLSPNALRVRAFRARAELQRCVARCLAGRPRKTP